jgi:large subunit ribosomal protein L15
MKLLNLKGNVKKARKRVGRGNGSGMGTYSCRGMNGQNSRSGGKRRPGFEGGQTPLIRRMPKLKGFRNPTRVEFQPVNVSDLEKLDTDKVDITVLYENNLISKKSLPVKILGTGELTKKLEVKIDKVSASAKEKIEKAGGKVVELIKEAPEKAPKKAKKTEEKEEEPKEEPKEDS